MFLFDTHTHLLDERFDEDRDALIGSLPEAGIRYCMEACCDEEGIEKIIALSEAYAHIYGSAGVHPHSASEWTDATAEHIRRALSHPRIRAVGEIGLDYHYDFSPRDVQKKVFAAQIDIAIDADKPIIVHDREAHGDCMDMLRAYRGRLSGIMHCFSGSYETAKECIDDGLYIAFGGALTFKNAHNRREIAAKLPLDRLLLETDCPYMTPEPHRGKRNDPRLTFRTLEVLASIRTEPIEEIARVTSENAMAVFGIR